MYSEDVILVTWRTEQVLKECRQTVRQSDPGPTIILRATAVSPPLAFIQLPNFNIDTRRTLQRTLYDKTSKGSTNCLSGTVDRGPGNATARWLALASRMNHAHGFESQTSSLNPGGTHMNPSSRYAASVRITLVSMHGIHCYMVGVDFAPHVRNGPAGDMTELHSTVNDCFRRVALLGAHQHR